MSIKKDLQSIPRRTSLKKILNGEAIPKRMIDRSELYTSQEPFGEKIHLNIQNKLKKANNEDVPLISLSETNESKHFNKTFLDNLNDQKTPDGNHSWDNVLNHGYNASTNPVTGKYYKIISYTSSAGTTRKAKISITSGGNIFDAIMTFHASSIDIKVIKQDNAFSTNFSKITVENDLLTRNVYLYCASGFTGSLNYRSIDYSNITFHDWIETTSPTEDWIFDLTEDNATISGKDAQTKVNTHNTITDNIHGVSSDIVGKDDSQKLTNKEIDANPDTDSNTIYNVPITRKFTINYNSSGATLNLMTSFDGLCVLAIDVKITIAWNGNQANNLLEVGDSDAGTSDTDSFVLDIGGAGANVLGSTGYKTETPCSRGGVHLWTGTCNRKKIYADNTWTIKVTRAADIGCTQGTAIIYITYIHIK